ncbi:MAG: hypothetical protein ACC646_02430 [Paracoccaceae bacterium]
MQYISTRGQAPAHNFEDTMLAGPARDGGLYVPETVPAMARAHISARTPMITPATAHPARFADAVRAATGQHPALPSHMADLLERHEHIERVKADVGALKTLIKERLKL